MKIGGFQKVSLIDYPGKICAIVFTQGCNFRCPYCHNPELVDQKLFTESISEDEIFSFLEKRKGKLDAVEITGGEPTLHNDLLDFIKKLKDMGFLVKLDTNGSFPDIVKKAISLIDYIAMDVKSPLEKYHEITRSNVDIKNIKRSIELIISSGIDYELRTTIVKSLLSKDDIIEIGKLIEGAKLYVLQKFVGSKTLNPDFIEEKTYSDEELEEMKRELEKYVQKCIIR